MLKSLNTFICFRCGTDTTQARCDSTVILAFLQSVSRHLRSRPAECSCVMEYIGVMDGVAEVDGQVKKHLAFKIFIWNGMQFYGLH